MLQSMLVVTDYGANTPALNVCVPEDVRASQFLRVIVNYLRNHPEKLHEDGGYLALYGMYDAFPCK